MVALGVVLLVGVATTALAATRDGVLPGTRVGGVDVGGLDRHELRGAVEDLAAHLAELPVRAARGSRSVEVTAAEVGFAVDVDATVDRVWRRGRQTNPVSAGVDQLRATVDPIELPPVATLDRDRFSAWADRIGRTLADPPQEADLRVEGGQITVVDPSAGEVVDPADLERQVRAALFQGRPADVEVRVVVQEPTTTADQVEPLLPLARQAVSRPVDLFRGTALIHLTPEDIGAALQVRFDGSGQAELAIDPDALAAQIPADVLAALHRPPVDATFAAHDGQVEVVPAEPGFAFDRDIAAEQVAELAFGDGPRVAELQGRAIEPDRTTAEAEAMGIVEEVASFTTTFPCCEDRVINIHRMAELVDGVLIEPGEVFSLNAHVGQRTTAAGFVPGGAISGGEFVDQVGGGASQFTTALFNAAWFAGCELIEWQPHSYYIDRYPVGREATLNWDPPVDLKFRNPSEHPIFVDTTWDATSVTVAFYGTKWVDVETVTGDRFGFTDPPEEREPTDELPAGTERVVQPGRQGFSIRVTRILTYPDGEVVEEVHTTTYRAEPRIIQVGTGRPDPEPTEAPPPPTMPDPAPPVEDPVPVAPPPPPAPPPPAPAPAPAPPPAPPAPDPTPTPAPTRPAARAEQLR